MALSDGLPSSPLAPSASSTEAIAYYKAQYESLEAELAEFQNSSKELEAELEKDIEEAEKRERQLKEKVGNLGYEVDEWKTKYKQSKAEASSALCTLQKEVTTLRDSNRTLQMRLRDTEVANDDFERQQRNTESSLEDLESKYSMAIERSVMMEEEIKTGEQEREALRIETQRLRDELSDLRIEAEITKEKWAHAEQTADRRIEMSPLRRATETVSPRADLSPTTSESMPSFDTPPSKTASSSGASDAHTPPSPPTSEVSTDAAKVFKTPSLPKSTISLTSDTNTTPRPSAAYNLKPASQNQRGPSIAAKDRSMPPTTIPNTFRQSRARADAVPARGRANNGGGLVQSNSIHHLHNLQGKMQRLTERVHTAKSKLPAPVNTPPKSSPRSNPANASHIPPTVTVRSSRKRLNSDNRSSSRLSGGSDSTTDVSRPDTECQTPSSSAAVARSSSLRPRPSFQSLAKASTSMRPPAATPTRLTTDMSTGSAAAISPDRSARDGSLLDPTSQLKQSHPYGHSRGQSHGQHIPSRPGSQASGTSAMSGMRAVPLGLNKRFSQHFNPPTRPNASTDRVRPRSSLSQYGYDGASDLDDIVAHVDTDAATTPTPARHKDGVVAGTRGRSRVSDVGIVVNSAIPTATSSRVSISRLPAPATSSTATKMAVGKEGERRATRQSFGFAGGPSFHSASPSRPSSSSSRPTSRQSIMSDGHGHGRLSLGGSRGLSIGEGASAHFRPSSSSSGGGGGVTPAPVSEDDGEDDTF